MSPDRIDRIVKPVFLGVGAGIPALIVARHLLGWDPLAGLPATARSGMTVVGAAFLVLGTLTCAVNVFLGIAAWWDRRAQGGAEGPHATSGLPLVGSLFIGAAAAFLVPRPGFGIAMLALYLIDGYGLPRAMVAMVRGDAG